MALLPQSVTDPVADAIFAHYKAKYGSEVQRPTLVLLPLVSPACASTGTLFGGQSLLSSLVACTESFSLVTYKNLEFMQTCLALAAQSSKSTLQLAGSGHSQNPPQATIFRAMPMASSRACRKRRSLRTCWRSRPHPTRCSKKCRNLA